LEGLDDFSASLGALDSEGVSLPAENLRLVLSEAREHDWPFDAAWSAAINRIQPSATGGHIDPLLERELREDRALLEEQRPFWRAAYNHAEPSVRDRAESTARTWARLELPVPEQYREDDPSAGPHRNGEGESGAELRIIPGEVEGRDERRGEDEDERAHRGAAA
jgi:hypothetical protein